MMNKVRTCFSYCLYGKFNPKYYTGLQNNINFIKSRFPKTLIHLWFGSDVEESYFKDISMNNITIIKLDISGHELMTHRFLSIDEPNVDIIFSRDADSMISEREIQFCNEFISSPFLLHTIRDHCGHFVPIMGGLFGIKKKLLQIHNLKMEDIIKKIKNLNVINFDYYNSDQELLKYLYINFRNFFVVHSTKNIFSDVNFIKINPPEDNNFCGQVIDYDQSGNRFMVHEYKNYD
jgi:hypothetical protein